MTSVMIIMSLSHMDWYRYISDSLLKHNEDCNASHLHFTKLEQATLVSHMKAQSGEAPKNMNVISVIKCLHKTPEC